jgi:hypothetical protein
MSDVCKIVTDCDTMDGDIDFGRGWIVASRDCIFVTHEGQSKFDTKIVVRCRVSDSDEVLLVIIIFNDHK